MMRETAGRTLIRRRLAWRFPACRVAGRSSSCRRTRIRRRAGATRMEPRTGRPRVQAERRTYAEAAGAPCTGGSGVTLCRLLQHGGDPQHIMGVFGTREGKELKLAFCVSARRRSEDPEITLSTGKPKVDREMLKFIRTYRYTPRHGRWRRGSPAMSASLPNSSF